MTKLVLRDHYTDDVARVFDRMHRQHGVSFDFPIGLQRAAGEPLAWEWLSHVDHDGIGAVTEILRRHGETLAMPRMKIRADRAASLGDHLRPFVRRSYLRAAPRSAWDRPRGQAAPDAGARRLPQHLILLSAEETRAVATTARALGVTVNSLALWSLAAATRGLATRPDERQHWTVPVNMRGGVGIDDGAANPLTFIRVPIWPRDTAATVHARLYELLETGMHWVMLGWIRFFARKTWLRFPPVRSTGVFSNIGVYRSDAIERFVICPPTGPTEPIAAGIISWNGCLSIALSVHESMSPSQAAIDEVGARWRRAILGGER